MSSPLLLLESFNLKHLLSGNGSKQYLMIKYADIMKCCPTLLLSSRVIIADIIQFNVRAIWASDDILYKILTIDFITVYCAILYSTVSLAVNFFYCH